MIKPFHFKQFKIHQHQNVFKIGTDGVLLGAWVEVRNAKNALDIGTGTGVIAMMLAQRNKNLCIQAIDLNKDACALAQKNFADCLWTERLSIAHQTLQNYTVSPKNRFDLIVTNPPYFNNGTLTKNKQKAQAKHTMTLSHQDLITGISLLLAPQGRFSLILPVEEGQQFQVLAEENGLYLSRLTEVRSKKDKPIERLLMEFQKEQKTIKLTKLTIQFERRNDFTPDYISLTKNFYTIL